MRVLVTGAEGLLGSEVVPVFKERHEVLAADVAEFDVTDLDATVAAVRGARPDAIVHCAAFSDVDGAEADLEAAFRVNGFGTKNVALAANEVGARLLYLSTDYVFDGRANHPYVEDDEENPLGAYARSKWLGEGIVRELAASFFVVRTQALYGRRGRSFVDAILERVRADEPLRVVNDQTTCPTRAEDLARALLRILEGGTEGIYHASSNGECTWFEFAASILRQIGRRDHPISPISTAELTLPAPRPAYSVLRNLRLELTIGDTLPQWEEALRAHLT